MKRFFAFGCSFTQYCYPTWADYIGAGFDEYYNYGRAGCSNTYIMNRLIESFHLDNLNPDTDTVIIMLTGFGRFSFKPNKHQWFTQGDMISYIYHTKDPVITYFLQNFWCDEFAVYQSWIATKVIKQMLESKSIPHKILMGINNQSYITDTANLEEKTISRAKEIYDLLDIKICFEEWQQIDEEYKHSPWWNNIGQRDGHPSHKVWFKYVQEHFPNLLSPAADELKKYWDENFDHSSQQNQGEKFNREWYNQHNKAKDHRIF